jgi:hypothetical protein
MIDTNFATTPTIERPRHRFTRDEVYFLVESNLLKGTSLRASNDSSVLGIGFQCPRDARSHQPWPKRASNCFYPFRHSNDYRKKRNSCGC